AAAGTPGCLSKLHRARGDPDRRFRQPLESAQSRVIRMPKPRISIRHLAGSATAILLAGCGGGGSSTGSGSVPPAPPGPIAIVSVNLAGVPGNGDSRDCGESCTNLSATGRFVAFTSEATDLVADDHNNRRDAFLRDMSAGVTVRVSVPHAGLGGEADDHSDNPSVSSDGRFVVFDSQAGNLVSGDSNGRRDVFLRDIRSGATVRVSQGLGAEADGASQRPCVSDDGRYVGFESFASNLVIGDTNGTVDVFVHDRETGT